VNESQQIRHGSDVLTGEAEAALQEPMCSPRSHVEEDNRLALLGGRVFASRGRVAMTSRLH